MNSISIDNCALKAHVKNIIPEDKRNFRGANYGLFNDNSRNAAGIMIKGMQNYLISPYIIDDFKDHDERLYWIAENDGHDGSERTYSTDFFRFYRSNCLGLNRFHIYTNPKSILMETLLDGYVGEEKEVLKEKIERLNEINMSSPDEYDEFESIEEKIGYVVELKERMFDFLNFIYDKSRELEENSD